MKDIRDSVLDDFQFTVRELLLRNKSIIDSITKFQDSTSRVNRTVSKAVTQCGCISINAKKQDINENCSFEEIQKSVKTHLEGNLCENCRDLLEKDIGRTLFYLTSLCSAFDLNLYDIMVKELERVNLLGKYNLR